MEDFCSVLKTATACENITNQFVWRLLVRKLDCLSTENKFFHICKMIYVNMNSFAVIFMNYVTLKTPMGDNRNTSFELQRVEKFVGHKNII